MFRGDRLEELLIALGLSQSELARRVGVSQTVIYKLVSGQSQGSKYIHRIASELGTSAEYLMGETDDSAPHGGVPTPPSATSKAAVKGVGEASDLVELHEFDVSFGLGLSFIHDVPVTGKKRVFSRAWVRQFTESPMEYLFFATGSGDSMMPTILDSDVVLIDSYDRTPRFADKLWAIEIGGMGSIKRLRPTKDGSGMILISSNPEVPDDVAYDGEMQIIGRVAGIFRKT
ncbi:S24 family peptidase [Erythrobacter sp. SG61-1L]|uniref:XRE family transcriptional regulator n=1 Tax=Erythrobacter sp. SG61-1L TaxID=1603897 RepID=UPI0006C91357|nr:S24 family peptidase [Erythrobacter sp. SG61-1L]